MKGIAYSEIDLAAKTTSQFLKGKSFSQDSILAEGIDEMGLDSVVIASKHKSASGNPALTVHSTGNFGPAELGGQEKTLQATDPQLKRNIFLELLKCDLDYSIVMECTHHGPTNFNTKIVFAELGSSEKQWNDVVAAEFLANAITKGLDSKEEAEVVIGFGGNHYCAPFNKLEKEFAFGHIMPKYASAFLTEDIVNQMLREKPVKAFIDKKSFKSEQRAWLKKMLEEKGLDYFI